MSKASTWLLSVLTLFLMVSSLGCETTKGAGKDIENTGENIGDAVNDAVN